MKPLAIILAMIATAAYATDGYQGRPSVCGNIPAGPRLIRCQEWVSTVQRPDVPGASCCGTADAFLADDFERGPNGELIAIITADYPDVTSTDQEGNTVTAPSPFHRGTKIVIPPDRVIVRPEDANRSGHGVVYLRPSNGEVLCYSFPPLT